MAKDYKGREVDVIKESPLQGLFRGLMSPGRRRTGTRRGKPYVIEASTFRGRKVMPTRHGKPIVKESAKLQAGQREKIKTKNFAIPSTKSYPLTDLAHARNALVRVRQFGSPSEKSQVYSAVTKKYPALATRSSVVPQKLQRKAERKAGVGKGQESMKLEAPKQKLSSVMLDAFADEATEIAKVAAARMRKLADILGPTKYDRALRSDILGPTKYDKALHSGFPGGRVGKGLLAAGALGTALLAGREWKKAKQVG